MITYLIILAISAAYFAFRWLTTAPSEFKSPETRQRNSAAGFVRASFRKMGQLKIMKDDRRMFNSGHRQAFA